MKYFIDNNKISYKLIILITIIIVILLVIYFNSYNLLYNNYNNYDNYNINEYSKDYFVNTENLNGLPVTNGLIALYNINSYSNRILKDLSGNGNDAILNGIITPMDNYIIGTIDSSIEFPDTILPEKYTFFHIAKYNGVNKGRIFSGIGNDWLSGFWNNRTGVAYHEDWLTINSNVPDTWIISTDQNSIYRANLNNYTSGYGNASTHLSVNSTKDKNLSKSDWAIACMIVYDRILTLDEIKLVENYLLINYKNLLKSLIIETPIVTVDDIINISPIINKSESESESKVLKYNLSANAISNNTTITSESILNNKIVNGKILNIKTEDDIKILMVDGKFRLRVNIPLMPPYIKGNDFDLINGINPNYFYLSVEKLDPNCQIYGKNINSEDNINEEKINCKLNSCCSSIYIDNKDCVNRKLSSNLDNAYRLVLIPARYALDENYPFKNIEFTLINNNGLLYLKNVNTGYLPKLFINDKQDLINGNIVNDEKTNISKISSELTNIICNEQVSPINMATNTINISCLSNPDTTKYLLSTKEVDKSSPINISINSGKININLNKYDIYGNVDEVLTLTTCNFDVNTFKYIEKITKDLTTYLINLVCLKKNPETNNKLNFMVELIEFSKYFSENSNIYNLE